MVADFGLMGTLGDAPFWPWDWFGGASKSKRVALGRLELDVEVRLCGFDGLLCGFLNLADLVCDAEQVA